jgi:hypothetical protein
MLLGIGSVDFEAATLSSQVPSIVGSAARAGCDSAKAATADRINIERRFIAFSSFGIEC